MKKVLWIAMNAGYDTVAHAGGKNENFYLKGLKKANDDVRVLSFALENEREKLDLDDYHIENEIKYYPNNVSKLFKMVDMYRYAKNAVKRYKKEGYEPDVVILQWTLMAFLIGYMKRIFPKAKYILAEEDVSFLAYKRMATYYTNWVKKFVFSCVYRLVKCLELKAIRKSDKTICSNKKDVKLLMDEGLSTELVTSWTPFYQDLSKAEYVGENKDVIFYGAMGRPENEMSAIWFIENVLPLVKDTGIRFVIVGGGVKDNLRTFASDQVKIEGFVENLEPYFSKSLCLAAPLVLGAGIKIKVLECMSAGLPVITNEIGIEGITAVDGEEYMHATTPQEYADAIKRLVEDRQLGQNISRSAKKFIKEEFDLDKSLKEFIAWIENM